MTISATNNAIQNPPNIDWSKMLSLLRQIQDLENDMLTNPEDAANDLALMKKDVDQLVQLDTNGYCPTNDGSFSKQLLALQTLLTTMQGGGFNPLSGIGIVPDLGQLDGLVKTLLRAILI